MPDLFNSPLRLVDATDRPAVLCALRNKGIVPVLKGRGRPSLYVNDRTTACVVARKTAHRGGHRWHFQRHGKLSRAEVAFLHTALKTA